MWWPQQRLHRTLNYITIHSFSFSDSCILISSFGKSMWCGRRFSLLQLNIVDSSHVTNQKKENNILYIVWCCKSYYGCSKCQCSHAGIQWMTRSITWRVSPEGSDVHLGSFINSHANIVGSSLYSIPVIAFFLVNMACKQNGNSSRWSQMATLLLTYYHEFKIFKVSKWLNRF